MEKLALELLEPYAWKSGLSGSKGATGPQGPRPTRCVEDYNPLMNSVSCPTCSRLLYSHRLRTCPFCSNDIPESHVEYESTITQVPTVTRRPDRNRDDTWISDTFLWYLCQMFDHTESSLTSQESDSRIEIVLASPTISPPVILDQFDCTWMFRMLLARFGYLIAQSYGGSGSLFARHESGDYLLEVSLDNSSGKACWLKAHSKRKTPNKAALSDRSPCWC